MQPQVEQQPDPIMVLSAIVASDNLAAQIEDNELARIGEQVVRDYKLDLESMSDWLERMKKGIELASLVKEEKNYPFPNASNIKYPLITTAALQYNARAYPAIVSSEGVVKCKTFGKDPGGGKAARADRVSAYMSYQFLDEIEEWEEDTDKLLVQLPIVGTMVRKVWYDPAAQRNRTRVIPAGNFIVNDAVKSLSDSPRASEKLPLYPSEIASRKITGQFRDVDYSESDGEDHQASELFIEQHCRIDLDGDGYEEPYIVTVHEPTSKVARIVADFDDGDISALNGQLLSIKRNSYFIPYHFLPSIDGGFFGTGLGLLLGDMSESINTIINMMMDAGHAASRGGGWIGKDFRIKGGSQVFKPGEWKMVNASGADIKNSVVPMTFPGPDATLFSLLGMLIDAGKDVASVKDVMTGETNGANVPATTILALIEQGMSVFTASYKRVFRSLKKEFRLVAKLNARHLPVEIYSAFHDIQNEQGQVMPVSPEADFGAADMDIRPVADPRSVTKMQEISKAQIVMQMADGGMLDRAKAAERVLQAAEVADYQELVAPPDPMQQQMAMMAMETAKADLTLKMVDIDSKLAEIEVQKSQVVKNLTDAAAAEVQLNLDAMKVTLEAMRDGLKQSLERATGGVAAVPNGGSGSVGPQAVNPGAGLGIATPVLGGQPPTGGGTIGFN